MPDPYDFAIVGGGIVGLATAMAIVRRGKTKVAVLEKEAVWAFHQTGHNSGVIHSGIYYVPGSMKARLATAGNRSMTEFCIRHGIPHGASGKIIVASESDEMVRLDELSRRADANGVDATRIDENEIRKLEPHVIGLGGLHVPSAGIVDFRRVCDRMASEIEASGGTLMTRARVETIRTLDDRVVLGTTRGAMEARYVIACAGLQSDRVVRLEGRDPGVRIVPFRGEYWELREEKRALIRGLVYPVPEPGLPFLGVHLTRMIDGRVLAGPNAVLALSREGYGRWSIDARDVLDEILFPGTWHVAKTMMRVGATEMFRAASRGAFLRAVRRLVPEIGRDDLVRAPSGIRAQAVGRDGSLVDDFMIVASERVLHVCNAPSPAATASLEIGEEIASRAAALGWIGEPERERF